VRAAAACEAEKDGIGSTRTCTGMDDVIGTGPGSGAGHESNGAELPVTLISDFSGMNGEIVEEDGCDGCGCVIILEESCPCPSWFGTGLFVDAGSVAVAVLAVGGTEETSTAAVESMVIIGRCTMCKLVYSKTADDGTRRVMSLLLTSHAFPIIRVYLLN